MMDDRKLLECAAKAAGFGLLFEFSEHGFDAKKHSVWKNEEIGSPWNPLKDDGDALRLAVRLNLCLGPNFDNDTAVAFGREGENITELFGDDKYAATRRAIVRSAAEIGKG